MPPRTPLKLAGEVETEGGYLGGYVKPANRKGERRDCRLARNRNGKRQSVVIIRERDSRSGTFVGMSEADGVAHVKARPEPTGS